MTIITWGEERRVSEKGRDVEVVPAWKWFLSREGGMAS